MVFFVCLFVCFFGVVGVGCRITEHGEKKRPVLNNFGLRSWNFNHITLLSLVPDIYCCITTIPKSTGVKL